MRKLYLILMIIGLLGISPLNAQEATQPPIPTRIGPWPTQTPGAILQPPSEFDFYHTGLAVKIKSKFNGTIHWRYISDANDIDIYLRMFYVNEFEYENGLEFVTDPNNQQIGTCVKVKLGTLSNKNIKVFLYVIHCVRAQMK